MSDVIDLNSRRAKEPSFIDPADYDFGVGQGADGTWGVVVGAKDKSLVFCFSEDDARLFAIGLIEAAGFCREYRTEDRR